MLPNGMYAGKATGPVQWTTSPNSGSDQVVVTLKATTGEFSGQTIDFIGSLSGRAVEITRKQLDALGYDGDDDASVTRNVVQFKVYDDDYNGKTYTKCSILTGVNYTPMSAQSQIAAKARLKAAKLTSGTNAAKTTEEEPF